MNAVTRFEFAAIVAYLEAATGKSPAAETVAVYWDLLHDLPADTLRRAARRVALEHAWATFPSAAEIRRAAVAPPGDQPSAWDAWGLVRLAVGRYGLSRGADALAGLPALAKRACEAIGWADLCDATEGAVVRAQFVRCYDALAESEVRRALLAPVTAAALPEARPRGALPGAVRGLLNGVGRGVNGEG